MFAVAEIKTQLVAETLRKHDTLFTGGDNIRDFAQMIGLYADFHEVRDCKVRHLGSALQEYSHHATADSMKFQHAGIEVRISECVEIYPELDNPQWVNYQLVEDGYLVWMKVRRPHYFNGALFGFQDSMSSAFSGPSYGLIADRIIKAMENETICGFCGVLYDKYHPHETHCCYCAMQEHEPCKYCKISTGRQDEDGAHRECKRRRLE